jgi:hypothetical protein
MADPVRTDLFKFVAVRPAERVRQKHIRDTIIHDPRGTTQDGIQLLRRLARELQSSGAALRKWQELELGRLERVGLAHREMVREYEAIKPDEEVPSGRDVLEKFGALEATEADQTGLLELAWDALYTADRTGPDAGIRLEVPIAALRVIHFTQLLDDEPEPASTAALRILRATPAIPWTFYDAIGVPDVVPRDVPVQSDHELISSEVLQRRNRLRELAHNIVSAERLLEEVSNAPMMPSPVLERSDRQEARGWSTHFALRTEPSLRTALSGRITQEQGTMLDRLRLSQESPIPVAAEKLQAHLLNLNESAFSFAADPEFQNYLMEYKTTSGLLSPGEAIGIQPTANIWAVEFDPSTAPDVSVSGRIVPLGIGDLKVVKQTLLAYVAGEVAHIENVLDGEKKERKHRKLDRTEITVFTSEEETKETERDTQSTDRFELKRETEQTIKEDMSVKAGLTVTATLGPVITTATGDFAYSTSKQDSQKTSSNFAREIVERSVSKVQLKTKHERTTKTLSEVEEINTHGVDNTDSGGAHVIGIYRWVDKRYRAQVYNYGVRLLLEFIVPEPASFYRAARLRRALKNVDATPPHAFVNIKGQPLSVSDITVGDYRKYVSRYNVAGVTPPPPLHTYVGTSITKEGLDLGKTIGLSTKEFVVPEGYTLEYYSATASMIWKNHPKFTMQIGKDSYLLLELDVAMGADKHNAVEGLPNEVAPANGSVPVSVTAYDVLAFAVNVQGICKRTDEALIKWQLQVYDKIAAAYQALQTAYDQKIAQAEAAQGIAIQGQNPAMNRAIEKTELKKLCITMMTGQHFSDFNAMTDPADKPKKHPEVDVYEALQEGPIVQFFEQAFEWEQMTYLLYPYFWGRKTNWVDLMHESDPDPLFMQFLTAGAARVVVPVPIAYADSVQYMLQSKDPDLRNRVWRGGERPTLSDPNNLYISITEELRNQTDDLAGAKPEGTPWEFTLPTTLVWLQPDSQLPTFPS